MTVLTEDTLRGILDYLDASIAKLCGEAGDLPEFQMDVERRRGFCETQYEVRLQNLLRSKNIDIHHLESGMKNMVIQRRQALLDRVM